MGSVRSPLWRHGGTVHGPQPRDYSYKLPRKMLLGRAAFGLVRQAARRRTEVVAGVSASPTTRPRHAARCSDKLEAREERAAGRSDGENRNLALGSRNLEGVTLVATREVTVYDLLGSLERAADRRRGPETLGGARRNDHLRSNQAARSSPKRASPKKKPSARCASKWRRTPTRRR